MIYMFGSTGMLGRYVAKYFESAGYDVMRINRSDIDAERPFGALIQGKLQRTGDRDAAINCMGLIRQKMTDNDTVKAIRINSVFPWVLNEMCKKAGLPLVHISTDCVFSGKAGGYHEESLVDAEDMYGLSKAAGEPNGCTVIRTSIIGEANDDKSLLEWVRSKDGDVISGYTHHLWNGVTCLQLARAIEKLIDNGIWYWGVIHYFSEMVTKAALVRMIVEEYGLNVIVGDVGGPVAVDRTLTSLYSNPFMGLETPGIRQQIREQRGWLD